MNGGELYIRVTGAWLSSVEWVAEGRSMSADALACPSGERGAV